MMYDVNPEGLQQRALENRKKPRVKGRFTTAGPNWVLSLDGHCKLMGFQKDTFPLAVYGCLDTASRKLLFLKVGTGILIQGLLDSGILNSFMRPSRLHPLSDSTKELKQEKWQHYIHICAVITMTWIHMTLLFLESQLLIRY